MTTFYKNLKIHNIILLFPYVYLIRLVSIIKDVLKADFPSALARCKAIFWTFFNIGKIAKKRRENQKRVTTATRLCQI